MPYTRVYFHSFLCQSQSLKIKDLYKPRVHTWQEMLACGSFQVHKMLSRSCQLKTHVPTTGYTNMKLTSQLAYVSRNFINMRRSKIKNYFLCRGNSGTESSCHREEPPIRAGTKKTNLPNKEGPNSVYDYVNHTVKKLLWNELIFTWITFNIQYLTTYLTVTALLDVSNNTIWYD